MRTKVANTREVPPDELLSESWKEEEGSAGIGGLVPVLGAVALFVALALIPTPSNNADMIGSQNVAYETPAQIASRYAASEATEWVATWVFATDSDCRLCSDHPVC